MARPRKACGHSRRNAGGKCSDCMLRRTREWKQSHPKEVRQSRRAYRSRLRLAALAALGGRCAHCGLTDARVLAIDHVNDDGAVERRELKNNDWKLLRRVLASAFAGEDRYQALCHNCNWLKHLETL